MSEEIDFDYQIISQHLELPSLHAWKISRFTSERKLGLRSSGNAILIFV